MSNDKMREEFEARFPLPEEMRWCEIVQQYSGHKDFWLWTDRLNVWKASREALVIELPEAKELEVSGVGCTYHDSFLDHIAVVEAIEAAGVNWKVKS